MSNKIVEAAPKQQLIKSFNLLKAHACKVANFTLQWQDLEDHLRFIHSQIESRLQLEQSTIKNKSPIESNTQNKPFVSIQNNPPETKINDKDKTETKKTNSAPVKNGKELLLYIDKHSKDLGNRLEDLLKAVDDPGKLVLEALQEFYPPGFRGGNVVSTTATRRSCIVLLEKFGKVKERVDQQVREEAVRLAVEWNRRAENSLEVLGFLQLLISFGLAGEFPCDEISKFFDSVDVVTGRKAPEMLRVLGFSDKASEIIQKLIKKDRRLEALRFIYEFNLVDQFPPVPLLKAQAKHAKKVAAKIRKKGNNSPKAQDDATKSQIDALRGIIRFIENYEFDSQYSWKNLRNHIQQLEKQRKESKEEAKATVSNAQSQQQKVSKHTAPAPKVQLNKQNKTKRPWTAASNASVNTSQGIHSEQPSICQSVSLFAGQGAQKVNKCTAPAPNAQKNQQNKNKRPRTAAPNASVNTSQGIHSEQPSICQSASLFAGQGAQYSTLSAGTDAPSYSGHNIQSIRQSCDQVSGLLTGAQSLTPSLGKYHSAALDASVSVTLDELAKANSYPYAGVESYTHSIQPRRGQVADLLTGAQHLTPSLRNYLSTSSTPVTSYTSLAAGSYRLPSSASVHSRVSSFPGLYERSSAANGSSGQFGFARTSTYMNVASNANTNVSASYYHGDLLGTSVNYNRQAFSSSMGFAPNTSGYYDSPASTSGNYGVSSMYSRQFISFNSAVKISIV